MEKVSCLEAKEELQVEVDCGETDKLTVELNLGIAEMFVSGLRYTIAIAFTLFIFVLSGTSAVQCGRIGGGPALEAGGQLEQRWTAETPPSMWTWRRAGGQLLQCRGRQETKVR